MSLYTRQSKRWEQIFNFLQQRNEASTKDIAEFLDRPQYDTYKSLCRLEKKGKVKRLRRGWYALADSYIEMGLDKEILIFMKTCHIAADSDLNEGFRAKDLAEFLNKSSSSVRRSLYRLEKKGKVKCIRRRRYTLDHRHTLNHISIETDLDKEILIFMRTCIIAEDSDVYYGSFWNHVFHRVFPKVNLKQVLDQLRACRIDGEPLFSEVEFERSTQLVFLTVPIKNDSLIKQLPSLDAGQGTDYWEALFLPETIEEESLAYRMRQHFNSC